MPTSALFPTRWLSTNVSPWVVASSSMSIEHGEITVKFFDSDPYSVALFSRNGRPLLVEHNILSLEAWINQFRNSAESATFWEYLLSL